jgi:DMSO/TMAO reductase YedYZ molybdopterin-dependent catalytic subunit
MSVTTGIRRRGAAVGGAAVGVAAAALAVGAAELVALATGPSSAPLVAVGAVVVDAAPDPVTEFGIAVFGVHNRLALQVGTLLLLGGAAAALGAAAVRRLWVGLAGLVTFALIGVAAATTRHDATASAAVPTVCGALAAVVVLVLLRRQLIREHAPPPTPLIMDSSGRSDGDTPTELHDQHGEVRSGEERSGEARSGGTRRWFLQAVGVTLAVAVVTGVGGRTLSTRRGVDLARGSVSLPSPGDPAAAVPAGANLNVPGLASYVTGNDDFYRIDTALVVPQLNPQDWTLRIHGRVRRPYEITFADLLDRPMLERYITLACVSNPVGGDLIGNARWLGTPVADLLAEAGPLPGADQVVSRSVDGWTCGTPTEVLTDGRDALLAIGMNGEPLPVEHGFPVRMVTPGLYGYVSACKWITEIELSSFDDYDAYWVPRGWAARAPVKTQSRIDTPRRRAPAGTVTVAGVAWAQHVGIERVEVRVDNGPWRVAELADTVSADTWRQWSFRWRAEPGPHRLTVRATDATGQTQPQEPSPVAPDGATGWHTVEVEVA